MPHHGPHATTAHSWYDDDDSADIYSGDLNVAPYFQVDDVDNQAAQGNGGDMAAHRGGDGRLHASSLIDINSAPAWAQSAIAAAVVIASIGLAVLLYRRIMNDPRENLKRYRFKRYSSSRQVEGNAEYGLMDTDGDERKQISRASQRIASQV